MQKATGLAGSQRNSNSLSAASALNPAPSQFVPPPSADTIMASHVQAARAVADMLLEAYQRLEALKGRLFGHEAATPDSASAAPQPDGKVYEMGAELDRQRSIVNALHGLITDLERLA